MEIRELLQHYWGFDSFRPMQERVIRSVLDGADTLALLPTGGGKSVCFQVPALARDGICIVVSPLIALMKDQVESLKKRGIKACSVTSGMHKREIDIAFDNCIYGDYKFLYLSPERLQTDLARERIGSMKVNLIAVDEAHCISQWGYDFRPSYLNIIALREIHPSVPILALTASATPQVQKDILDKLHFNKENIIRQSFTRENLSYIVLYEEDKLRKLQEIIRKIKGSGIVYVKSRKQASDIAGFLKSKGIAASFYHAGLDPEERSRVQDQWKKGTCRVIVATNAFGMGIDKPDVRFVVHADTPESLEAYYQEAGRAGRDGKQAYAVLLYTERDRLELETKSVQSFPDPETVRKIYQALGNYFQLAVGAGQGISYDFDLSAFCSRYKFPAIRVYHALKFLERYGYLTFTEDIFLPSRICFIVGNMELYAFQVANPGFDALIKTLLRSYGGITDQYTKVSESELAGRIKISTANLIKELKKLDQEGMISYLPRKDQPQITFLLPREEPHRLEIDVRFIEERKKAYHDRIRAMIAYASSRTTCRNMLLLDYFGEKHDGNCGNCDVCRELHKAEISNADVESVRKQIATFSPEEIINLHRLLERIKGIPEQKKLKIIRFLADSGELKPDIISHS